MSILGIESVIFAVNDMAENTRFWSDFGIPLVSSNADEAVFELASGSRMILCNSGDARLPIPDPYPGFGVKETIWGVDSAL
jgi:catechol 2,3-dioxygenase-like lactoylglutathione lyase family enzyme